jgi:Spy/CpxP family protein refolding chaperone
MKPWNSNLPLYWWMSHAATGVKIQGIVQKSALLTIAFAIVALSLVCQAQNQEPTIDSTIAVVRANMRASRAALITTDMNFTDKDGAAFWPIYQQYEYQRSRLDDRRAAVIKQYTQKYPNLTDAEAKAMADQMLDCEFRLAELKKKYYTKFNKALPALTVTKFFQLERRIDLMMDMQVEASLPPLTQTQYSGPESNVAEPSEQ